MQLLSQECCLQAVPFRLSPSAPQGHRTTSLSGLFPFRLSLSGCPLLFRKAIVQLLSQGCPLEAALFKSRRSPYSLSLCAILFRLSHSVCPLQAVPFSLSSSFCPIQSVLFRLSHSVCPLQAGSFRLSFSGSPLQAAPSGCFLKRLSHSGCPIQAVLFRLFCSVPRGQHTASLRGLPYSGCPLLPSKVTVQLLSQDSSLQAVPFKAVPFCLARSPCSFSPRDCSFQAVLFCPARSPCSFSLRDVTSVHAAFLGSSSCQCWSKCSSVIGVVLREHTIS